MQLLHLLQGVPETLRKAVLVATCLPLGLFRFTARENAYTKSDREFAKYLYIRNSELVTELVRRDITDLKRTPNMTACVAKRFA